MVENSTLIFGITISWSLYNSQKSQDLTQLPLTKKDGEIFEKLFREDMRLPQDRRIWLQDPTVKQFTDQLQKVKSLASTASKLFLIVHFAGHGHSVNTLAAGYFNYEILDFRREFQNLQNSQNNVWILYLHDSCLDKAISQFARKGIQQQIQQLPAGIHKFVMLAPIQQGETAFDSFKFSEKYANYLKELLLKKNGQIDFYSDFVDFSGGTDFDLTSTITLQPKDKITIDFYAEANKTYMSVEMENGKYEGDWQNNKQNGFGNFVYKSGDIYCGAWVNGQKHGQGVYKYADGAEYDGAWHDDQRQGQGKLKFISGTTYEGEWQKGKQNGMGICKYASGAKYDGHWDNGKRHGKGFHRYPNGDTYDGDWVDDKRHGRGKVQQANGSKYEGDFINDRFN